MKKHCRVRQRDVTDCGAACLASVFAFYGLHVPVARVRQWAGTGKAGTTLSGLLRAAEKVKMNAKAVKAPLESLSTVPLPAIAHVVVNNAHGHYVVLLDTGNARLELMDPAEGAFKRIGISDFAEIWTGALLLLNPGEGFTTNKKTATWKKITTLIRPHRKHLALASGCAIVFSLLGLAGTVYLQRIVDGVLERQDVLLLSMLSLLMLFLLLLQYGAGLLKGFLALRSSQAIDQSLVMGYYRHLLRLPQAFFDTMQTGEMVSRINDAVRINAFVNELVLTAVVDVMILLSSIALMFLYYWKLALLMTVIVPIYLVMFYWSNRINKRWQRRIMEAGADLESLFVQSLSAASTIKKLAVEELVHDKINRRYNGLLKMVSVSSWKQIRIQVSADFVTRFFMVVILWSGCYFVLRGVLSKGELLSFYAMISYFTAPVLSLLSTNRNVCDAFIAADRLFEIMELQTDEQLTGSTEKFDLDGDIELRNVSFGYDSSNMVLQNISIVICKGSCMGIKGESGSGKSTLAALLLKLYEPLRGGIYVNGASLARIEGRQWRAHAVPVPQFTDLFNGSIFENIILDKPEDKARLKDICDRLGISEFVARLPSGWHTMMHEQGVNLSGGQRQLISIARALYRHPRVLILDEPSASLDRETENKIMQTIEWYRKLGNTVIIISHSDAALKICDNIVVLKNGKTIDQLYSTFIT
jgi:ATP-binding cassette subfamily B protein